MAKSVFSIAQSLKKRPSEIAGGFGHPFNDFIFDMMIFSEFSVDDQGNVKRQSSVTADQLLDAHKKGLDELAIAEMLGVKVARRNSPTH